MMSSVTWQIVYIAIATAGLISMAVWVVRLRRRNAALVVERDRAVEVSEAAARRFPNANFIARMWHELATPVNAIIGFAKRLRENPGLREDQGDDLDRIQRSGEHQLKVIRELVDTLRTEPRGELVDANDDLAAQQQAEIDMSSAIAASIRSVCFELRQVLTMIQGYSQLRQRRPEVSEKADEVTEIQCERMRDMLDELTDLGNLIEGRLFLNEEDFDLVSTVNDLMPSAHLEHLDIQWEVCVDGDPDELIVNGDSRLLKKVLSDLVMHSVMTARGGCVTLHVSRPGETAEFSDQGYRFSVESRVGTTESQVLDSIQLSPPYITRRRLELAGSVLEIRSSGDVCECVFDYPLSAGTGHAEDDRVEQSVNDGQAARD